MVKVRISNIKFGEREVEILSGKVSDIIKALGTNDDSVIFVDKEGNIYTSDKIVSDGMNLNMIEVFSGG
ncbi:hypothetical protein IHI26_00245 [Candidatus Parvarchaeota archaeon]|jgi:sulfur carrier protein ThiS|nr:hypothetical protein [Candidatus Acidifodinimicrobium mancum]MBE5729758.1 hypothetical protein [Candidatus Acidifodinimicrobium mancum]